MNTFSYKNLMQPSQAFSQGNSIFHKIPHALGHSSPIQNKALLNAQKKYKTNKNKNKSKNDTIGAIHTRV